MGYNKSKPKSRRVVATHEGGKGYRTSGNAELYRLVCASFMAGDTFYESNDDRLERFKKLVAGSDAKFLVALATYARREMHLRTTPTLLLAEAYLQKKIAGKIASGLAELHVWARGDEHLEALAYTLEQTGGKLPNAFKRAVARRLGRLTELQAKKYQRTGRSVSQADAVRLIHPNPRGAAQSALFKYVTHGWDELDRKERDLLPRLRSYHEEGDALTWEQRISTKGASRETWLEAIPGMGYMALLRNLRNFEQHLEREDLKPIAARIANPEEVAKSKQLPFRFYSAYVNTSNPLFRAALEEALEHSVKNVSLDLSNSVVIVDTSGSMSAPVSPRSEVEAVDVAGVLAAIAARRGGARLVEFATYVREVSYRKSDGVLAIKQKFDTAGGATYLSPALDHIFSSGQKYDRVIILSDFQVMDGGFDWLSGRRSASPFDIFKENSDKWEKVYAINIGGYAPAGLQERHPNVLEVAGWSDRIFDFIRAIETNDPVHMIQDWFTGLWITQEDSHDQEKETEGQEEAETDNKG